MKSMSRRSFIFRTALASASSYIAAFPFSAAAQAYPNRPVRIIVPVAAGGTTDVLARVIAQRLQERLKQAVIVENKPGGGYVLGTLAAAQSAPDGHTLVLTTRGSMVLNPLLHKKLPYDPAKDFVQVALAASFPLALVVHSSLPIHNVQEFIQYVRMRPGEVDYASAGNASSSHLAMELLQHQAKLKLVHVPYKGASPATTDMVSGIVKVGFDSLTSAMPHVKAGKLRAIAIASAERSILAPNLPTIAEGGVKAYDMSGWYGLAAPSGTPQTIVDLLSKEIVAMMADPVIRESLTSKGLEPIGKDASAAARVIREEVQVWTKVVRDTNYSLT